MKFKTCADKTMKISAKARYAKLWIGYTKTVMKIKIISILLFSFYLIFGSYASEIKTVPHVVKLPDTIEAIRIPSTTNYATLVWLHGGGLVGGKPHFPFSRDEKIAQVAVKYRLLGKDAKSGVDCIEDAADAVAWTMKNIHKYGGDTNKIFLAGMSAGGYLTMMVGMDPKYLAAHGLKNTDLAALIPISGQATKHYNVRKFSGDKDPQFLPKIDDLAPLAHVSADIPPIVSICGQPPYEWKCRSEENRLLIASCIALGHKNAKFIELPYCNHGQAYECALPYLIRYINE